MAQINEVTVQYVQQYHIVAIQNMQMYHIPASITLAQGILESGSGMSNLATQANNHFGIKCHKEWIGDTFTMDDDTVGECFRVYASPMESYSDHSLFLTTRSRYAKLFTLDVYDYTGWAKGLKAAGYATNPKYPELLIKLIETYDLAKYDKNHESFLKGDTATRIDPGKATIAELTPTRTRPVRDSSDMLIYTPIPKETTSTKKEEIVSTKEVGKKKNNSSSNTSKKKEPKNKRKVKETAQFIIQFDDISSDKIIYTYDVEEPKENQTPSCKEVQKTSKTSTPIKHAEPVKPVAVNTTPEKMATDIPCGSVCNGVKYVTVAKGETFYGLSKKNAISIQDILDYNDLPSNYVLQIGDRLYIEKKKDKNPSTLYHEVKEGESLLYISQLYAVKKKALMKINNFQDDAVSVGQKIMLQ